MNDNRFKILSLALLLLLVFGLFLSGLVRPPAELSIVPAVKRQRNQITNYSVQITNRDIGVSY